MRLPSQWLPYKPALADTISGTVAWSGLLLSGARAAYVTLRDLWSFCRGQVGELTKDRMWTKTYILSLLQGGTAQSFSSLGYDIVSALLCWPRRG